MNNSKFLWFLIPIVFFSLIQNVDASPIVKMYDDTFKIVKTSSLLFPSDPGTQYSDTVSFVNLGNETAILSWQISKLQLASHSGISGAPAILSLEDDASEHSPKKFTIKPSFNTPLEPNSDPNRKQGRTVEMSMAVESDITSTYEGKIWLYGNGIDPIPVDIEVKIIHNQFEFILFALGGIGFALLFGTIETWRVFKKNSSNDNKTKTIGTKFKIDMISNDTVWSVKICPFIKKDDKKNLEPSTPSSRFSYLLSRLTLGALSVGLSLPAAIFGNEYFTGMPVFDVIIAAGIGFVTYRSQDFKKLYKGDKSKD